MGGRDHTQTLLPLREKVAGEAGRMRGRAGRSAAIVRWRGKFHMVLAPRSEEDSEVRPLIRLASRATFSRKGRRL